MKNNELKGWQLLKEIAEGNIKEGTYIEVHNLCVMDTVVCTILYTNGKLNWETGTFDTSFLIDNNTYFKIKSEEINIQDIEKITICTAEEENLAQKINELVQAVKYLDNKLKER